MKVEMEGVGPLPKLSMECKGLTMITGINNVGKSIILKAVYSVLGHASEYDEYKEMQITQTLSDLCRQYCSEKGDYNAWSMSRGVDEYLDLLTKAEIKGEGDLKKLDYVKGLIDGTNDDDFFLKMTMSSIRQEFGSISQFINMVGEGPANIKVDLDRPLAFTIDDVGGSSFDGDYRDVPGMFYYDSPFHIDGVVPSKRLGFGILDHRDTLSFSLAERRVNDPYEEDVSESRTRKFDELIGKAVFGKFVNTANGLEYRTSEGLTLYTGNIAAGIKIFATVRMLVDKGLLKEGSILLLDEPETHLHPQWINVLSEVIISLVKDLDVRIIMTTHNPQLIMGIEGRSGEISDKVSYYHLSSDEGRISFNDVTDNIEVVYDEMAGPIREAASPFW